MTTTAARPDTSVAARGSRKVSVGMLLRENLPAFVFFVIILAIWEALAIAGALPAYLLPAPSAIFMQMISSGDQLLKHTLVTVTEIVLGYMAGIAAGFLGALAIFYSRTLQRIVYPIVLLSQFVPKLAIAPLLIIWFGFTITPKIVVTALICLFPILINTVAGLNASDPQLLDLMHTLDAKRWQVFVKIRLPAAMPHIFAGLKVGITLATIGAIVAEWISAEAGLGYLIVFALGFFKIEQMFSALVMITLVGLVLFLLIALLERIVTPHQPAIDYRNETT
jgi:NitT/TauT family transport system permease protein